MSNRTRIRLQSGAPATVLTLDFPTPSLAEFAGNLGYTALAVDLEHGTPAWADVENLARACDVAGVDLIVRIPPSAELADRCIDAGVHGLHLTHVEDAEAVQQISRRFRPAPEGSRGIARTRSTRYGHLEGGYGSLTSRALPFLMITVESARGVEALPSLLELAEVDAVFVGAFDLSADWGFLGEPRNPTVQERIEAEIIEPSRAQGKFIGLSASNARDSSQAIARGGSLLLASQARLLFRAAQEHLDVLNETGVPA